MNVFIKNLEKTFDIRIVHSEESLPFESTYSINHSGKIEKLRLREIPLNDIEVLLPLAPYLKELVLNECLINNVLSIEEFKQLEILDLSANEITNFKGIEQLSRLKKLSLYPIDSDYRFEYIRQLTNLKQLDLSMANITSVSGLEELPELEILNLKNTYIEHFGDVREFKKLKHLCLASCHDLDFGRLNELSKMRSLEVLDLSSSSIATLENIKDLTQLYQLNVSWTNISEITHLEKLNKLRVLLLQGDETHISEIKGLSSLLDLRILDLSVNNISKIKGLNSLHKLNYLKLASNKISEIKEGVFDRITKECIVDLSFNPLEMTSLAIPPHIKIKIAQEYYASPTVYPYTLDEKSLLKKVREFYKDIL